VTTVSARKLAAAGTAAVGVAIAAFAYLEVGGLPGVLYAAGICLAAFVGAVAILAGRTEEATALDLVPQTVAATKPPLWRRKTHIIAGLTAELAATAAELEEHRHALANLATQLSRESEAASRNAARLELQIRELEAERDRLTKLDSPIGDADHGSNMDRGFAAVVEKLDGLDDTPPGKVMVTAGSTLVSTVGGASGPLWGTALRRAGRSLGDDETFDGAELAAALEAALDGVVELGAAQPGDKTMVDALEPAVRTLKEQLNGPATPADALAAALAAAEEGMRATVPLQATKGRASYLGERSIGHQDPGATSTVIILRALEHAVAAEQ